MKREVGDQPKELKRLSREELLELLLSQSKELEQVKQERDQYKKELQNRRIAIKESGSIAEAALKLSGIFEAAQKAADDYLANIRDEASNQQPGLTVVSGQSDSRMIKSYQSSESEAADEIDKQSEPYISQTQQLDSDIENILEDSLAEPLEMKFYDI